MREKSVCFQKLDGRWKKEAKCGRNTEDVGDLVGQHWSQPSRQLHVQN